VAFFSRGGTRGVRRALEDGHKCKYLTRPQALMAQLNQLVEAR
jgi:hypothetical protein